jgi:hypothetical protein
VCYRGSASWILFCPNFIAERLQDWPGAEKSLYRIKSAITTSLYSNLHPAGFDELMPKTLATTMDRCCATATSARPAATPSASPRPSQEKE